MLRPSFYELVAELARPSFAPISTSRRNRVRADHASYIEHWLKVLRDDKRAIFTPASHARARRIT